MKCRRSKAILPLVQYLAVIILTGLACITLAQTEIEPDLLTIEDGLSQGYISAILQDQEGFLWFSTKNGLNRYDGRKFEEFTKDQENLNSISGNWVTCIVEEGDFLVIGTTNSYLNLFHKKTKKFYHISLTINKVDEFGYVSSIYVDSNGQYWINTEREHHLLRVVFPNHFWEKFPQDSSLIQSIKVDLVLREFRCREVSKDSNYLIIENYGQVVKKMNTLTLDTTAIDKKSAYAQFPIFKSIGPNISLCDTKFSTGSHPLKIGVLRNGKWRIIASDFLFKNNGFVDPKSNLVWLQRSIDFTLLAFDLDQLLDAQTIEEKDAIYIVKNIKTTIRDYYMDRSGVLWLGTAGLGVMRISPRKLAIKNYLQGLSMVDNIFTFWKDRFLIYAQTSVGTFSIGIDPLDPHPVVHFLEETEPFEIFWMDKGSVQPWLAIVNNDIYNSKFELVLYRYIDQLLVKVIQIPLPETWSDSELSMVRGVDGNLYVSFSNYFIQYDPKTNSHQLFTLDLFKKNVPSLFYMAQTLQGDFWIGTSQGLIRGQARDNGFDFELVKAIQNDICASLLVDPQNGNILWIGTKGAGLIRLDTETMERTDLNTKNGLPNDVIYAVLNDESGNLWLSSNKGIITYHPKTGKIRNFTSDDGMQSNEFNTYAFGKSPDGALIFGGINGLNVFHPKDLRDNPYRPEVRITQLEINNQTVSTLDSTHILEKAIEYTDNITLDFANNSISLTFAALEFTTPGKNTFSYYMEGAEAEWVHTTTDNRAAYLNLSPGNYSFKIKAANGDMLWSEKVTTLAITILPPWYRSSIAYFFYCLLIGLVIWISIRLQRRRIELTYNLELERKEAERLKELESFRSKLYTNITHEFRTPLTVILGTSERLEAANPKLKQLSLIRRSGKNLLNLINQILDLAKIEHNKLEINYQQGDILPYLRYITESFHAVANANNILLKLETKQSEIIMDYDPEKIRQILSNLLSNAVKYTPSGGKVLLSIEQQAQLLHLKVSDSGKGIPAADLPHVFNRFYQAENDVSKAGGSGIGLALTRELINLLGGNISVESEVDKGTVFNLYLPIKHQARLEEFSPLHHEKKDQISLPVEKGNGEPAEQFPSLLIIEDNLDVVEYFALCLESQFELTFAYNGQAGIDKAFELTPDLIISDVMMPEKTGFEVTETLKQDERTSHIPIVLLTAKADLESRLEGVKLGADIYLPKPFYREELIAILENLLKLRKQLQAKYSDLSQVERSVQSTDEAQLLTQDKEDAFLQKIRAIVEKDLSDNEVGNLQLIRGLGMSKSQIYKKVKALTGKSPSSYIRSIRLHHAKNLLETGNENVSEVAFQVGFTSLNYFSRSYFEEFGIRPSETLKGL